MAIGPKSERIDFKNLDLEVRNVYDAAGHKLTGAISGVTPVAATTPTIVTATATTGSFPTADGAVTVADAATPTVAELQEFCIELKKNIADLITEMAQVKTAVNAIIAA